MDKVGFNLSTDGGDINERQKKKHLYPDILYTNVTTSLFKILKWNFSPYKVKTPTDERKEQKGKKAPIAVCKKIKII